MLKAIESATRQKIEPITLPTRSEVADRRVSQFKQQVLEVLADEKLDFFFEVVRQMEEEVNEEGQKYSARQIATALAFLATRDRPLQPEGREFTESAPPAPRREPREESRPERPAREFREEPRAERPAREYREEPRSERPARESREEFKTDRPPRRDESGSERPARRPSFSDSNLVRYRIEVGRQDGVMPKEIVGAIANEGGIEGRYIGQIHLFDAYTTVELPAGMPAETLSILKRTRVRQKPLNIRLADAGDGEGQRAPQRSFKSEGKPPFPGKDRPPFRSEGKPSYPPKDRSFPSSDRPFPPNSSFKKPKPR
jgi:ATP-dependent RNA helicase DeaD